MVIDTSFKEKEVRLFEEGTLIFSAKISMGLELYSKGELNLWRVFLSLWSAS